MSRLRATCLSSLGLVFMMVLADSSLLAADWSPLWTTTRLSVARSVITSTSWGNQAFFGGGANSSGPSNVVDIYDVSTGTWAIGQLSEARYDMAAASAGGKVFFAGGYKPSGAFGMTFDEVDIYDTTTGNWSVAHLSQPRHALAAAAVDGKVFFAGGYGPGGYSNIVDIYDTATSTWSTASLSQGRSSLAAATANGKVYFGGGIHGTNRYSNVVDIYDTATGTWSTSTLSKARLQLASGAVDGKVVFAGGYAAGYYLDNTIDVLDVASNTWTTAKLSVARARDASASCAGKVLIGGGFGPGYIGGRMEIYDAASDTWSTGKMPTARTNVGATSVGNQAFFAAGQTEVSSSYQDIVEIYTVQNYDTISSSQAFTLVDTTTVAGRMQLHAGASLNLDGYDLAVGSMSGAATINLSDRTLTVGMDDTDSDYLGGISGNGSLVKTGDGVLTLSGDNSYLGLTTINAGELHLVGTDAWNPVTDLGGAYISSGQLVFDYAGTTDPFTTIAGLLGTKINGSMPLFVTDDVINSRVIVSTVPEPSTLALLAVGAIGVLGCARRRQGSGA